MEANVLSLSIIICSDEGQQFGVVSWSRIGLHPNKRFLVYEITDDLLQNCQTKYKYPDREPLHLLYIVNNKPSAFQGLSLQVFLQ